MGRNTRLLSLIIDSNWILSVTGKCPELTGSCEPGAGGGMLNEIIIIIGKIVENKLQVFLAMCRQKFNYNVGYWSFIKDISALRQD